MNTVSISLIRTPFQLFNAIEATTYFNKKGVNILICIYKNNTDKDICETIINYDYWTEVHFFKLNFINKLFYSFTLGSIIKKYKNVKYCFFGLITSYLVDSINKIDADNNILIDDGNETLLIASNIVNNKYHKKIVEKKFIKNLLNRQFNLDFLKNIKFFTFYDLTYYIPSKNIINNTYNNFKKSIINLNTEEEVFFIGSNLIDTYVTKEYYEEIIKNVSNYYSSYKITYIPHRYEDLEYLKNLSTRYKFKIKKFDTILELAIQKYGKKPIGIISIRSTAIETISYLYNISFTNIIKVDTNKLLKEEQIVEYKNLYKNYENKKIPIIEVN